MSELPLLARFERAVRDVTDVLAPDWHVSCVATSGGNVIVSVTHPVSLGYEWHALGRQVEAGDVSTLAAIIKQSPEFALPPPLSLNPGLLRGIRTLTSAFGWPEQQVSALAGVLEDSRVVTPEEAEWLGRVSAATHGDSR